MIGKVKLNWSKQRDQEEMQSPSTYTTIPISGTDVISRSFQSLTAFISRTRPWSEFIAAGVFDQPESISHSVDRLRKNSNYFGLNYAILVFASAILSLVGTPLSLLVVAAIFALWLILYFFREDPLYLWDHHVSDRVVLVALISASLLAISFTGAIENMILGFGMGLLVSGLHGVFRNPDGLFLDENEAVSKGLIRSAASPPSSLDRMDTTR